MTLICGELKVITSDQSPGSVFISAVNNLFYRLEHIKSQIKSNLVKILKFKNLITLRNILYLQSKF